MERRHGNPRFVECLCDRCGNPQLCRCRRGSRYLRVGCRQGNGSPREKAWCPTVSPQYPQHRDHGGGHDVPRALPPDFSEIEAAEQELSQTLAAPRGRLRVSLPLAGMLFMPAITKFMRLFPDVSIDLDFTDRLVDVIEEGFDAVVRTGDISDSRLMMRSVGRFSHRIVATEEYLARFGRPEKPQDLSAHICLHHKYPSSGKLERWPLRHDVKQGKLEVPVSSMASTLEPLVSMAEQGLGLACLPLFTVHAQIAGGSLCRFWAIISRMSVSSAFCGHPAGTCRQRCRRSCGSWARTCSGGDATCGSAHHLPIRANCSYPRPAEAATMAKSEPSKVRTWTVRER